MPGTPGTSGSSGYRPAPTLLKDSRGVWVRPPSRLPKARYASGKARTPAGARVENGRQRPSSGSGMDGYGDGFREGENYFSAREFRRISAEVLRKGEGTITCYPLQVQASNASYSACDPIQNQRIPSSESVPSARCPNPTLTLQKRPVFFKCSEGCLGSSLRRA